MMTLEQIEARLRDSIKNGTQSDISYWRGYRDAFNAYNSKDDILWPFHIFRNVPVFYHGLSSETLEKQANIQGYTLGDRAEEFEEYKLAHNILRNEYLTEEQRERLWTHILMNLLVALKPLEKKIIKRRNNNEQLQRQT